MSYQPGPHSFHPIPWWGFVVRRGLNLRKTTREVHVLGFDEPLPPPETSADEKHGEQHQGEVIRDERVSRPSAPEEHSPTTKLYKESGLTP